MARPRILLTNDDGVLASGLRAAYEALRELGDVTVVAPSSQRSGASHTITLEAPLRAHALEDLPGYRVDFTPVDCVKLALKELLPEPPDLVVSGINRGLNGGHLIHYSGTVGAAVEAALNGIPAIAFSKALTRGGGDFSASARVVRGVTRRVLAEGLDPGVVLNVNVPGCPFEELKGMRWCRMSMQPLEDDYDARDDPRGRPYYWLSGAGRLDGVEPADDLSLLKAGYVTLTPLTLDWTHPERFGAGGEAYLAELTDL